MTTDRLVPARRVCCVRAPRAEVSAILRAYLQRGELLTPWSKVQVTRHRGGEETATFHIRTLRPAADVDPTDLLPRHTARSVALGAVAALRAAWGLAALRRFVYVALTLAGLFLAGRFAWLALADDIGAAVSAIGKVLVVLVMIVGTVGMFRGDEVDRCARRHRRRR
jgi:hypothetical protein